MNAKHLHYFSAVALVVLIWGIMHYDGTRYTWIWRVNDRLVCDENEWMYRRGVAFHPCYATSWTLANCSIEFVSLFLPLLLLALYLRPWSRPAQ